MMHDIWIAIAIMAGVWLAWFLRPDDEDDDAHG